MFMSGIADEAGPDLATQIRAHRELGWEQIEIRNVNGVQFHDLPHDAFETACGQLADAGMHVSCFASAVANWATNVGESFDRDREIVRRALPRMRRLGTPFLRVMSYPNKGLTDEAWRDEAVRRLGELARMAGGEGVRLVLENCDGWASVSPANFAEIFERVDHPAFKAVYDTGNPASHGHANTWEWYRAARPQIVYVHIKANTGPRPDGAPGDHVWPEEGDSRVAETLFDLFRTGYDGGFSIEPHMKAVVHEGKKITDAEAAYQTYVEYGRRAERMVRDAAAAAAKAKQLIESCDGCDECC